MEEAEFEAFFRAEFPRLVRYAQRRVPPAQAEDMAVAAMQTMWTKNLPSPEKETDRRGLRALAYRVLDGHLRNAVRADAAYQKAVRSAALQQGTQLMPDIAEDHVAQVWPEWARSLSPTDLEVLGFVVDGYRVSEIAVILECTPAAVTMRLQRAYTKLRQLWREVVDRES